jgi:pimeloyl-ACP methyl ester carboxylesterase
MSINQAKAPQELAARAVARGLPRTIALSMGETAYWYYPATTAPETTIDGSNSTKTILLVHGYRGNHHGLEAIAGALTEFNVVIPDLPGFGESAGFAGKYNIANYAAWLLELVERLPIQPMAVLGHSFGSIVTASAAANGLNCPIVFLNPISSFGRTGAKRVLAALQNGFYSLGGWLPNKAGNALLSWPVAVRLMSVYLTKSRNKSLRNWIHQQHNDNFSDYLDRRVLIEGIRAGEEASVVDFAPNISQPVLVIAAEHDDVTALSDQMRLVTLFSNAQFRLLNGVGHLTHYETPNEVAELAKGFLN